MSSTPAPAGDNNANSLMVSRGGWRFDSSLPGPFLQHNSPHSGLIFGSASGTVISADFGWMDNDLLSASAQAHATANGFGPMMPEVWRDIVTLDSAGNIRVFIYNGNGNYN